MLNEDLKLKSHKGLLRSLCSLLWKLDFPFPRRDEHAVGVHVLRPDETLGRAAEYRKGFELGMGRGEGLGDCGGLAAGQGADGVDEPAAGLERAGDMVEQLGLEVGEFAHILECRAPAGVGIALPGADAAAGGVDQDAVEFRFGRKEGAAIPVDRAVVEDLGPTGPLSQRGQAAGGPVAGPDHALVFHLVGQMQGLAAFTGAGVPPGFAGLGPAGEADQLRREVLDFEKTLVKLVRAEEIVESAEAIRGGGRRRRRDIGGQVGRRAIAERAGDGAGELALDADPERRIALQLLQPGQREGVDLGGDPIRDRPGGEGLGLDRGLFRVVASLQG